MVEVSVKFLVVSWALTILICSQIFGFTMTKWLLHSPGTTSDETSSSSSSDRKERDDGWHSIEVFIGNHSHLDRKPVRNPGSQVGQDRLIANLFNQKKNGYFVDLASNDARVLSNTFNLERQYQWTGLCIEPNPIYWYDLAYRDCQVVAAAVGMNRMEEVNFVFENTIYGGIVSGNFDNKAAKNFVPKFTVPLLEILQKFHAPKVIDYLSLDVEGAEDYIMSVFPLEQYTIKVMTVERPNQHLREFLVSHHFTLMKNLTDWGETLWLHQSFVNEVGMDKVSAAIG